MDLGDQLSGLTATVVTIKSHEQATTLGLGAVIKDPDMVHDGHLSREGD